MTSQPDPILREEYENAAFEVDFPGGTRLFRVGPEGAPGIEPFLLLTAWDPGHERPTLEENQANNARLETDFRQRGWRYLTARGRNAENTHMEPSFAVFAAPEDEILGLARKYDQAAVFAWDGSEGRLIWC